MQTTVVESSFDEFVLNDESRSDRKVLDWLAKLRESFAIPTVKVVSTSNFPSNGGLASSAAGFAALILILNEEFKLDLDQSELNRWARLGSASAARSLHQGFVTMEPNDIDCDVQTILESDEWPLKVVIAVTSSHEKPTSSSEGMIRTAATSPYFDSWVRSTYKDFAEGVNAVKNRDFEDLARIAERSCRKMHALMWSTEPPLMYWNPTTLACIQLIQELHTRGIPVFYTVDAGPQVKVVCRQSHVDEIESSLKALDGVESTHTCGIGDAANCVTL